MDMIRNAQIVRDCLARFGLDSRYMLDWLRNHYPG